MKFKVKEIFRLVALTLCIITLTQSGFTYANETENKKEVTGESLPEYVDGEIIVKIKEDILDSEEEITLEKVKTATIGGLKAKRILDIEEKVKKVKMKKEKKKEEISEKKLIKEVYKEMDKKEKELFKTYKIELPKKMTMEEALDKLKKDKNVEYAEPNYISYAHGMDVRNNTRYIEQWAHTLTHAEQGWSNYTMGNSEVIVAVVDSGVDYNHEDLSTNIWRDENGNPGKDFVHLTDEAIGSYASSGFFTVPGEDYKDIDDDPFDVRGHGTHCAGIVAAVNNDRGVVGVSPNVKIMPVRAGMALSNYGKEVGILPMDAIVQGIKYAADQGADIISMSFGGKTESSLRREAMDYAYAKGAFLIASAGNDNTSTYSYPAAYENVLAVAAVGEAGVKSYYSNYGSWVDLAAPGGDFKKDTGVLSTVPSRLNSSGYEFFQGTSMAAPYVSGLVALMLSHDKDLTQEEIKEILQRGVNKDIIQPNDIGVGTVDVFKTLELVNYLKEKEDGEGVTIYYKKGFSTPYIHYKQGNGIWTAVPGVKMLDSEFQGYSKITIDIENLTPLEACFNDGNGKWDSRNGANYFFNKGISTFENGVIKVGKPQVDIEAPTKPYFLKAFDVTSNALVLNWSPSYDNVKVTGYEIYRNGIKVGNSDGINLYHGEPFFQDTNLMPDTTYTYTVKAYDATGNKSEESEVYTVTTAKGVSNTVTVYYKRGFATPYIHYKQASGVWTVAPGVKMPESEFTGYNKITIDIGNLAQLEACFNDGNGRWDSRNGANYFFNKGVYTFEAGQIKQGIPSMQFISKLNSIETLLWVA